MSGSATEATAELVAELGPDGVDRRDRRACRRGAASPRVNPLVDELPGVRQENVVDGLGVRSGRCAVGDRVVVLDDDGARVRRRDVRGAARRRQAGRARHARSTRSSRARCTTLDMAPLYARLLTKGLVDRLNPGPAASTARRVSVFNLYTGAPSRDRGRGHRRARDGAEGGRRALLRRSRAGREPAPDRRLRRAAEARPCDLRGRARRPRAVAIRRSATSTRASSSEPKQQS